jgi:N-terminal acetyltransferase B complex catalytic subunit
MDFLEKVSEVVHDAYYVDLFVRSSNAVAINMYKKLGYDIYQAVDQYKYMF